MKLNYNLAGLLVFPKSILLELIPTKMKMLEKYDMY